MTPPCAGALNGLETPQAVIHAAGMMAAAPLGELDAAASQRLWRLHVQAAETLANHFAPQMPPRADCGDWQPHITRRGRAFTVCGDQSGAGGHGAELGGRTGASRHYRQCGRARRNANADAERAGRESSPNVPPIGRLITPQEVAALVGFVLSADAAAITGRRELVICGGASLK